MNFYNLLVTFSDARWEFSGCSAATLLLNMLNNYRIVVVCNNDSSLILNLLGFLDMYNLLIYCLLRFTS